MSGLIAKFPVGRRLTLAMILGIFTLLASCQTVPPGTGPKGNKPNPLKVTINFQGNSKCVITSVVPEANTCVGLPDPADICIKFSKFLRWESNPEGVGFNIYFDPLKNGPTHTAPNGKKRVQIESKGNIPPGTYKYAILGRDDSCDPDTHTVDPRIRVDN